MTRNNRTATIRYLLIASGVLVVAGLGSVACSLFQDEQSDEVRFYESEQECLADAANAKNGLVKEQCQAQFQYAKQEYERITPVYKTQQDCQEDTGGICSQSLNLSDTASGWRPDFGGFYYTHETSAQLPTTVVYGNSYPIYPVQPVYRSPVGIVTPDRVPISRPVRGVPLESSYFSPSLDAPARPQGYAAKGTIKGRGNFGSAVRSTAPRGSRGK